MPWSPNFCSRLYVLCVCLFSRCAVVHPNNKTVIFCCVPAPRSWLFHPLTPVSLFVNVALIRCSHAEREKSSAAQNETKATACTRYRHRKYATQQKCKTEREREKKKTEKRENAGPMTYASDNPPALVWENAGKEFCLQRLDGASEVSVYVRDDACLLKSWVRTT